MSLLAVAVGVDMIEMSRVAEAIDRHGKRFCDRIFTPQEQEYCAGRIPSLAGRFALKEAVAKALGTGVGDMNWTDIEILADERSKPRLVLHNNALAIAMAQGWHTWDVTISHTNSHAIGFVVAGKSQSS